MYRLTRDVFAGADQLVSESSLDRAVFNWDKFDGVIHNDNLTVEQTNRLIVLRLYEDGRIYNSVQLCECCDGLDLDTLDYGTKVAA